MMVSFPKKVKANFLRKHCLRVSRLSLKDYLVSTIKFSMIDLHDEWWCGRGVANTHDPTWRGEEVWCILRLTIALLIVIMMLLISRHIMNMIFSTWSNFTVVHSRQHEKYFPTNLRKSFIPLTNIPLRSCHSHICYKFSTAATDRKTQEGNLKLKRSSLLTPH